MRSKIILLSIIVITIILSIKLIETMSRALVIFVLSCIIMIL